MKKIFLTTIALLSIASVSVFGMYGVNSGDWIGFLTHGNQFRARVNQLGFTLGNDTIKGTFGFFNNGRGAWGSMLSTNTSDLGQGLYYDFTPTISMGLAYTSSLISVGVGYNATIGPRWTKYNGKTEGKKTEAVVHTPVLVLNAMDNAFRMAIPIQVVNLTDKFDDLKGSVTAVSLEAQFRYYSGLDFLPQIRLYIKYGNYGAQLSGGGDKIKQTFAESFGFDFRLYFGSMVEEVAIQPIVKLAYNGALGKQHNKTSVTAISALNDSANYAEQFAQYVAGGGTATEPTSSYSDGATWKKGAWDLKIIPALGITANSDIVSLYVEPSLGFQINQKGSATDNKVKELYSLYYGAYAEIYITPLKNLEWYFEVDLNNGGTTADQSAITFAGTTGITWYLPAL
ncbi:cell surface protein [Brachyspira aalborgi]|uniref:Cell surface protein n=2 Tax=Brachyspira aalborgi TaxID=29522 RepID=A0A5C8CJ88_9SPIR|nr:cell surface protein [Brachyspira aalborgi]TXJ13359.1 cell surface protein [Brachyspira aalborgi]